MEQSSIKFSLILATVGRNEDLERFLSSLDLQTYRNFELIIVDQNEDDRLVPIIGSFQGNFHIIHLRSERGLSRARNIGLKHITGDIVAFPDDDCWYPDADLLKNVADFFNANPDTDGYTGRSEDVNGASDCRWLSRSAVVTKHNVWITVTSFTIFLKRRLAESVGGFDESLGVGSGTLWGSGEEIDYVLRALESGALLVYEPGLVVFHPWKEMVRNEYFLSRVESYARGAGKVIHKNKLSFWVLFYMNIRSFGGFIISMCRWDIWKARLYLSAIKGRAKGWLGNSSCGLKR